MRTPLYDRGEGSASDPVLSFFAGAPAGYCRVDSGGLIIEANEAAASLLCVPLTELVGMPLAELLASLRNRPFVHEKTEGNSSRIMLFPQPSAAWEALRSLDEVETSERAFEQACGAIGQFAYSADLKGRFTCMTQGIASWLGYEQEELIGRELESLVDPADSSAVREDRLCQFGGAPSRPLQVRLRHNHGHYTPVILAERLLYRRGNPSGFRGIVRREPLSDVDCREIRATLHGLFGMADLLLSTGLNREQLEYAKSVRQSAEALLAALNRAGADVERQPSLGFRNRDSGERPTEQRILVVEDNSVSRKLLTCALEKMGYRVDAVDDGIKAVAAAAALPYDLIFMDVEMPALDGYGATQAIRRTPRCASVPIVAVTANATELDSELCHKAGMSAVLHKPLRFEDLSAATERWLK